MMIFNNKSFGNLPGRAFKVLNNEKFQGMAESTMISMAVATGLKAVGRPIFIYKDKNANAETKKYSAAKEFLYQSLCLGIYLSLIPLFKQGGFALAKKVFSDDVDVMKVFKKFEEPGERGITKIAKEFKRFMHEYHIDKEKDILSHEMKKIKGGVEATSILGSVLGLAVLAPQISHVVLHPIMNFLGITNKKAEPGVNKVA